MTTFKFYAFMYVKTKDIYYYGTLRGALTEMIRSMSLDPKNKTSIKKYELDHDDSDEFLQLFEFDSVALSEYMESRGVDDIDDTMLRDYDCEECGSDNDDDDEDCDDEDEEEEEDEEDEDDDESSSDEDEPLVK